MIPNNDGIDFEELYDQLGGFGPFQVLIFCLASLCSFYCGNFVLGPIFGSKVLPHRCKIPSCDTNFSIYDEDFLNFTTPWDENKKTWDECHRYALSSPTLQPDSVFSTASPIVGCNPSDFDSSRIVSCEEWIYDTQEFNSTVNEFNLVCSRSWLIPWETSALMLGFLFGSLVMGIVADKFGRVSGVLVCGCALFAGGIAAALSPNFYFLLGARILGGMGAIGFFQVSFVAAIEYIVVRWRTICGVSLNIPYAFGEIIIVLMAYLIRDWRYLYIACAIPVSLAFLYYWIMPESVRWLLIRNRLPEAIDVLNKIGKLNKSQVPEDIQQQLMNPNLCVKEPTEQKSILHLLKSPIIRKRSLVLFYCWMVCSLMYYGLSAYVGSFSGNFFFNITLVVIVETPGYVCSAIIANQIGRKLTLIIAFIGGGLACVTAGFLSPDFNALIISLSLVGKFGITLAFGCIFLYSGEIYPTEYRAIGIGTCSMHSRIGGIIAPFISNLAYTYKPLPSLIFGILSCLAGILLFFLPETMGESLPQTLKDSENIGRNQSWSYFAIFDKTKKQEITKM